jgi:hypothetical protein
MTCHSFRSMARTPEGNVKKEESDTALYSYVASRVERVSGKEKKDRFLRTDLGVAVAHNAIEKRVSGVRARLSIDPFETTFQVDEAALGLHRILLHFPGDGASQSDLQDALESTPGIRQILEGGHARDLWAVAVVRNDEDRALLRAALSELTDRFIWDEVLFETHRPAAQTWRELARRAAEDERLLLE